MIRLAAILMLAGCSTMERQVAGWPEMAISTHVIAASQVYAVCGGANGFGSLPLACAYVNLPQLECHIYITETTPQSTIDHEVMHCHGWDHDGILQAAFDNMR